MKPDVAQLISALPPELAALDDTSSPIERMLDGLARRPVPTGRARRLWALGTMEARLALGYAAYALRRLVTTGDRRERALYEAHIDGAMRLLAGMGFLRGAAAKVGQLLVLCPDLLPEVYDELLGALYFQAPPMHFSLLRQVMRRELGDDPERVFDAFEMRPLASASLGQVHRARLKSGEAVAVKIQYPGIARAIRSDLRNLRTLLLPLRLSGDWDNIKEQLRVLCEMLEQETDYHREARFCRIARAALSGRDETIVVPRVFEEFSTQRVLTMELLPGVHLPQLLRRSPGQAERDEWGRLITEALFRLFYGHRFVFADPSPGNFIFMPDGRLGLVDFGCCHEFTEEEWSYVMRLDGWVDAETAEQVRECIAFGAMLTDRQAADAERIETLSEAASWLREPFRHEGPFHFGGDYMRRGIRAYSEIAKRGYLRNGPLYSWFHRMFLGYRAILSRLDASVDVRSIHRREVAAIAQD